MSDDSRVPQAALSPSQWAEEITKLDGDAQAGVPFWRANSELLRRRGRHAAAALCLFGTPEGFTHEDVELVREAMKSMSFRFNDAIAIKYSNLSLRIAALLPPSSSEP